MIGETISHYRILEKIGEGGMGVVYKAEDTRLDRLVAIKVLAAHLSSDDNAKRRFIHEAKAASAIEHTHIATVHDIGETPDGKIFIVMGYYAGQTLRDKVAQGVVGVDDALQVMSQIAAGLVEAHAKGVVHRDLKPANVIVTNSGQVKVVDFGLAKLREATRITKSDTALGTLSYMSPEQLRGESVDARSDIFSLGCVFYELLTARSPFSGDHDAAIMYSIANEEPSSIKKYRSGAFDEVQRIINRALKKNPDDRYQSVRDFKSDVDALRSGSTEVPSHPPSGKRRRGIGVGLVAGTLTVIAALVVWQLRHDVTPLVSEAQALAIIDFRDLSESENPGVSAGLTGLLQVGLIESAPCRVISPEYMYEMRRQLFKATTGPITPDQALEIARKSGATILLSGQRYGNQPGQFVTWQLVDTQTGSSLGAHRVEGEALSALADGVIAGVIPVLSSRCGTEPSPTPTSVTNLTTASEEAYTHYTTAIELGDRSQWDDMEDELRVAVEVDSTFALAWFELARTLGGHNSRGRASGKGQAGCDAGERAWTLRSRLGVKDRMLLEAWLDRDCNDDIPGAIETHREIVARWPDDRDALDELCGMLLWIHLYGDAVVVAEAALENYPDDRSLKESLSIGLGTVGRFDEQIALNREFVAAEPDDPSHWQAIGWAYLGLGLPDSAEVAFDRALRIDPDSEWAQTGKAQCLARRGDNMAAAREFRRLGRMGRGFGAYGVAQLLAASGRHQWAMSVLDSVGGMGPEQGRFGSYILYFFTSERGHKSELLAALTSGIDELEKASTPIDAFRARWGIVSSAIALDSMQLARPHFEAMQASVAENVFPENTFWMSLCAQFTLADGRAQDALEYFERVEKIGINPAGTYFILHRSGKARALHMLGRNEEAAATLQELHRVNRGHWLAQYELGQVFQDMGRTEDAISAYEMFLDGWADADSGLTQLVDAKRQVRSLRGIVTTGGE